MKKLYSFIFALLAVVTLLGQAPESFKYQAVLRNTRGDIKTSSAAIIGINILKGSATGLSVYSETHNVTTDRYGLINLEIGKGTSPIGTFSDVDWSAGSYYIKLTVDGIEMGTSQLLSVPYALYAKTSGNEISKFDFSGAAPSDILQFNGTKWVKLTPNFALTSHLHSDATTSTSGFMSGTDKTKLNGLQNADGSETKVTPGTNITVTGTGTTPDPYIIEAAVNGSETKVAAGTNVTVTGTGTTSSPYVINSSSNGTIHNIGDSYGGGIVFFVYDNGQHGLIAAPEDISIFDGESYNTYFPWFNIYYPDGPEYMLTGTNNDGLGAGAMNTTIIVSSQASYNYYNGNALNNYAAQVCVDYEISDVDEITFGDWYLPSIYELNLLYTQKAKIGNLAEDIYWSSTEFSDSNAYFQNFIDGISSYDYDSYYDSFYSKEDYFLIRAIRSF
jgi:hypothetical protein